MQNDSGTWLSAQQAVLPDGTELTGLPLVNKKLPPLSKIDEQPRSDETEANVGKQS